MSFWVFPSFFSSPIPAPESESCGDHSDQSPFVMAAWLWRRLPAHPLLCSGETTWDKCERRIPQLAEKTSLEESLQLFDLHVKQIHLSPSICATLQTRALPFAIWKKRELAFLFFSLLILYPSLLYFTYQWIRFRSGKVASWTNLM